MDHGTSDHRFTRSLEKVKSMDQTHQIHLPSHNESTAPERLCTLHQAAEILALHYWQLQRAVRRGDIPSYTPFNSRKLVKLSEVLAYIESCRAGGTE